MVLGIRLGYTLLERAMGNGQFNRGREEGNLTKKLLHVRHRSVQLRVAKKLRSIASPKTKVMNT